MRSIGIRVLGIAVILASASCSGLLGGNAGDLAVGDCFDLPAGESGTVTDLPVQACTDAHDAEVIFVGDYEPATDAYPSESEFTDYETDRCITAFNTYTGLDFNTDDLYNMGTLEPTPEGWAGGDREVTCYLHRIDATKLTTSLRKA